MRRRDLLALLGTAAALRPRAGAAQEPDRMRRIGVLMAYGESDRLQQTYVAAFREGLRKLGWTEGDNIRIDYRWAALDAGAVQRFAKELVKPHPDLIISDNTPTNFRPCCNRPALSRSFSCLLPIQWGAALPRASLGRAATLLGLLLQRARWAANGCSFSRRLPRKSLGSPSCSTRQRCRMLNII